MGSLHCTFLYGFEYFGVKWFNFAIISGIIFLISGLFGIMAGSFLPYKNLAIAYLVSTILASILALILLFPIGFGILISFTRNRRPYLDYRGQYYWCEGLAIAIYAMIFIIGLIQAFISRISSINQYVPEIKRIYTI